MRACPKLQEHRFRITGVAVIDVVEGSRKQSPASDHEQSTDAHFVYSQSTRLRPSRSCTVCSTLARKASTAQKRPLSGSEWPPRKVRHAESAHGFRRISVQTNTIRNPMSARVSVPGIIVPAPPGSPASSPAYLWRTPLRSTAPYWTSMFYALCTCLPNPD